MTFNFKYNRRKEPIFENPFSPGQTSGMGENGVAGDKGKQGASLYFINYEPDNDFVKDLLLNKIENNIVLSSDKGKKLPDGKYYVSGDLILTSNYYMYQIIDAEGESKYKFDIRFVGELRSTSTEDMSDEAILSRLVQGVALNEKITQVSAIRRSLVPVSRSMDSSIDAVWITNPDKKYTFYKRMYSSEMYNNSPSLPFNKVEDSMACIELQPVLIMNPSTALDVWVNYDFYLRIYLKNIKKPTYNSVDGQLTGSSHDYPNTYNMSRDVGSYSGNFIFYKCIELPLCKITSGSENLTTLTGVPSYYLTDMAMDKAHPSGNNFASLLIIPEEDSGSGQGFDRGLCRRINGNDYGFITNYMFNPTFQGGTTPCCRGLFFTSVPNTSLFKYYRKVIRDLDFSTIEAEFDSSTYRNASSLIQYSLRYIPTSEGLSRTMPNYRGGESSYFSGMTTFIPQDANYEIDGTVYPEFFVNQPASSGTDCTIDGTFDEYATNIRSLNYNISMLDPSNYSGGLAAVVVDEDASISGEAIMQRAQNALIARRQYVMDTVKKKMEDFLFSSGNMFELCCVNKTTGRVYNIQTNYTR